jgi:hypothetical protein
MFSFSPVHQDVTWDDFSETGQREEIKKRFIPT